jgi:hypothetical protein
VDPRDGLDAVEKRKFLTLQGLELPPLDRPARSQPLYRLRYPGSCIDYITERKIEVLLYLDIRLRRHTGCVEARLHRS